MADLDDRLKALWVGRKREDPLFDIDEMGLAAWFDAGCPENEAIDSWLSNDPASRETLYFLLEEARSTRPQPSAETIESLQGSILGHLRESSAGRRRRPVLASIGLQSMAAAAAIVVAALGFSFGQSAAPATNEATNNFVAAVTFELLGTDSNDLESVLLATGLTVSESAEGDAP